MNKLGILTFHRAVNYGAVLQTYSLLTCLKKTGVDARIIDYRNSVIEQFYYKPYDSCRGIKNNLKSLIRWKKQKKRNERFFDFTNNYLDLTTDTYHDSSELTNLQDEFDIFLAGSDQIWNYECTGGDLAYVFSFLKNNKKKNSYAASFGKINLPDPNYDIMFRYINEFKWLSVRETVGKRVISQELKRKAEVHIDPVFLLERNEWEDIARYHYQSPYILLYSVDLNQEVLTTAKKLVADSKMRLVIISLSNKYIRNNCLITDESGCSPQEFLGFILHAEAIVTNSFHGAAFSIVFNKEFYLVKNRQNALDNSRLEMLLEQFGLTGQMVSDKRRIKRNSIRFNDVNKEVLKQRNEAIEYLKRVVGLNGTE